MNMAASHIDAKTIAPGGRPLGLFAINLDRSPDRWAEIERGFGNLPWPVTRVKAVDARKDAQEVLAVRGTALQMPPQALGWNAHRNRLFMLTEEACLAGHVMAWRQFLASDFEHAIILEDDAVPLAGFATVVADLLGRVSMRMSSSWKASTEQAAARFCRLRLLATGSLCARCVRSRGLRPI